MYLYQNVFQHQIIDNCREPANNQNLAMNHRRMNKPAHTEEFSAQYHFTFKYLFTSLKIIKYLMDNLNFQDMFFKYILHFENSKY